MRRSLIPPPWERLHTGEAQEQAATERPAQPQRACILVVDDQATVRNPICTLLTLHGYGALAAESGEQALAFLASGQRVSLALLDIMMPNAQIEGIETARLLKEKYRVLCLMLTSLQEAAIRVSASLAGALGYLVKDIASDAAILETVERALTGEPIPNPLAGVKIDPVEALSIFQRKERVREAWASLTPQQQRVAQLAANGLTNKQIAEELIVEPSTINTHMQDVLARLGLLGRKALQDHYIYDAALERDTSMR